jgi:hypothetical protein
MDPFMLCNVKEGHAGARKLMFAAAK